jgi:hypothetical protein
MAVDVPTLTNSQMAEVKEDTLETGYTIHLTKGRKFQDLENFPRAEKFCPALSLSLTGLVV